MKRQFLVVAGVLLAVGAIAFASGLIDSAATRQALATTCPSGFIFPAQTCLDLSARLQGDGALTAMGFVLLGLGLLAVVLGFGQRRLQRVPDISVTVFARPK